MPSRIRRIAHWGLDRVLLAGLSTLGDMSLFAGSTFRWMIFRRPYGRTLAPAMVNVGYQSAAVVIITGFFIGMVLAVHSYAEFKKFGFVSWSGRMINASVIRELGPVLAATMLAGRVGGSMAAEMATMRVSEQIDALSCLGANPIHYLVVPRFLACVLMIPLLTLMADLGGVFGAELICVEIYGVEAHDYWRHSRDSVQMFDIFAGMIKPITFGALISLIACHRGFRSRAGAEGVGRAATEAFVVSFVAILIADFLLALLLDRVSDEFTRWGR